MIKKKIETITEEDIEKLIEIQVLESKTTEYNSEIPVNALDFIKIW